MIIGGVYFGVKKLLTHAVATQALFIGGALQIIVTDGQAHGVAAGVTKRTVTIAGHRHTHALLGCVASKALRAMALFHMAQHQAFGILATCLRLLTGVEALTALTHFR